MNRNLIQRPSDSYRKERAVIRHENLTNGPRVRDSNLEGTGKRFVPDFR